MKHQVWCIDDYRVRSTLLTIATDDDDEAADLAKQYWNASEHGREQMLANDSRIVDYSIGTYDHIDGSDDDVQWIEDIEEEGA